jgi:4'-phosphopantetheinyl transferase
MSWPALVEPEIHLWVVALDAEPAEVVGLLSRAERERAERFRFQQHRRRWMVARAALRTLLGRYLTLEPQEIQLEVTPGGKMSVETLQFNLSHSHDLALVAVAVHTPVGVDVEIVRPIPEAPRLARRVLPPEEAGLVEMQPDQFLRVWTRREAWLKAEGIGLPGLRRPRPADWRILDLDPLPGYVGALAFRGDAVVSIRHFAGDHRL